MPRFVVLIHDHPEMHWDFLLEQETDCLTWRLAQPPWPGVACPGEAIVNHRKHYLTWEGPVSGNRGTVTRFDAGEYQREESEPGTLRLTLTDSQRGVREVAAEWQPEQQRWWFQFI